MNVLVATGRNAFSVKERLKQLGFKWYRQEKLWVIDTAHDFPALRDAVAATGLTIQTGTMPDDVGRQLFARAGRTAQAAVEALAEPVAPTPALAPVRAPTSQSAPLTPPSSLDLARAAAARAALPAASVVSSGNTVAVTSPAPCAFTSVEADLAGLKAQAKTMRALMVEIAITIESIEQKLKA